MNKAIKVDAAGGTVDPQFIGVGNNDNVIVPIEVRECRITTVTTHEHYARPDEKAKTKILQ